MVDYRFNDPMQGVRQGYEMGNALRQDGARRRAGNALKGGDYGSAADELYGAGMLSEGSEVQNYGQAQADRHTKATQAREAEVAKALAEDATRLRNLYDATPGDDQVKKARVLAGFDQIAPRWRQLGETDEELAQFRGQLEGDADLALFALGAGAAKKAGYEIVKGSDGSYVAVDTGTGRPAYQFRPASTVKLAEGDQLMEIPGSDGAFMPQLPQRRDPATEGLTGIVPEQTQSQPAPEAPVTVAALDALPGRIGGRITSGRRTPERNAQVGGVPNSKHLTDEARDFVPPAGVSMADFERQVRANVPPGAQVINEGDHIHVEIDGGGRRAQAPASGPRVIASRPKAAKPQSRPATAEEKRAYGIPEDTAAQIKPDGSIDVVGGVGAANNNPRKAEADLRKEFNGRPEVKEYRDVSTSYNTIRDLFSKPSSAAGDVSAIFSFMKMLDPGSVVREGEFATAQNAAGVPDIVLNAYNRALKGERLNPKQRADFLAQAGSIYSTRTRRYGELVGEYRGYAQDYGLNPDRIGTPPAAPAPQQQRQARPAPPRVGQVVRGFRYKGGDPAKQTSWERAR